MISKSLVNAVVKEATKLREHATSVELNRIAFTRLDPISPTECIYGQATGSCTNGRSIELITKCAGVIYDLRRESMSDASCALPRATKPQFKQTRTNDGAWEFFSPIETYIAQMGADNKTLIRFLKGKLDTLDLTHTINC